MKHLFYMNMQDYKITAKRPCWDLFVTDNKHLFVFTSQYWTKIDENFKVLWRAPERGMLDISIRGDKLIYISKKKNLHCYALIDMQKLFEIELGGESYLIRQEDNDISTCYVRKTVENNQEILKIDINKGQIVLQTTISLSEKLLIVFNKSILSYLEGVVKKYDKETFDFVWEYSYEEDISTEGKNPIDDFFKHIESFLKTYEYLDDYIIMQDYDYLLYLNNETGEKITSFEGAGVSHKSMVDLDILPKELGCNHPILILLKDEVFMIDFKAEKGGTLNFFQGKYDDKFPPIITEEGDEITFEAIELCYHKGKFYCKADTPKLSYLLIFDGEKDYYDAVIPLNTGYYKPICAFNYAFINDKIFISAPAEGMMFRIEMK